MRSRLWRWAILAGLALIVLSLALFLVPQRGHLSVERAFFNGCDDESAPLGAVHRCEHDANVRLDESATALVVGSLLVLAGAVGSRLTVADAEF